MNFHSFGICYAAFLLLSIPRGMDRFAADVLQIFTPAPTTENVSVFTAILWFLVVWNLVVLVALGASELKNKKSSSDSQPSP